MRTEINWLRTFVWAAFGLAIMNVLGGCAMLQAWGLTDGAGGPGPGAEQTVSLLAMLGGAVGGPIGYAITGVGSALMPLWKWWSHKRNAVGMIRAVQEGRANLPPDARKYFDNKVREVMNDTLPGNVRAYVRKNKANLKKKGLMALDRLSDKHKTG